MKKSIVVLAAVSLLSISVSTFAFAETTTVNTPKQEAPKTGTVSSTKPMNRGKSEAAKARIISKKEAMGKPMNKKAVTNMTKKTGAATTTTR